MKYLTDRLSRERSRVASLVRDREIAEFYASLRTPCLAHWLETMRVLTTDIDLGRLAIRRLEIECEARGCSGK